MIPYLAMVRVGGRRRGIRLWLPLFLLWPLVPPFAVVLAVAAAVMTRNVAAALRTAWQLASGCRGMHIEVDRPEIALRIRFI